MILAIELIGTIMVEVVIVMTKCQYLFRVQKRVYHYEKEVFDLLTTVVVQSDKCTPDDRMD